MAAKGSAPITAAQDAPVPRRGNIWPRARRSEQRLGPINRNHLIDSLINSSREQEISARDTNTVDRFMTSQAMWNLFAVTCGRLGTEIRLTIIIQSSGKVFFMLTLGQRRQEGHREEGKEGCSKFQFGNGIPIEITTGSINTWDNEKLGDGIKLWPMEEQLPKTTPFKGIINRHRYNPRISNLDISDNEKINIKCFSINYHKTKQTDKTFRADLSTTR